MGDFNGDGKTDLAVANYDSNTVSILLGKGDGTFQTKTDYAVGGGPCPSRLAISTATARPTWPWPTDYSNTVSILLGNGDGTFQTKTDYAVRR